MQIAKARRVEEKDSKYALQTKWYDDDLSSVMTMLNPHPCLDTTTRVRRRNFKAWMDVNDYHNLAVNHLSAKSMLLAKFGGLTWEDNGSTFIASKEEMRWIRLVSDSTKKGWALVAHDTILYDPSKSYQDNRDTGAIEEVPITVELCLAIAKYYDENPSPFIRIIRQEEVADVCTNDDN